MSKDSSPDQVETCSHSSRADQELQGGVHVRHREMQISHLRDTALSQRQERYTNLNSETLRIRATVEQNIAFSLYTNLLLDYRRHKTLSHRS